MLVRPSAQVVQHLALGTLFQAGHLQVVAPEDRRRRRARCARRTPGRRSRAPSTAFSSPATSSSRLAPRRVRTRRGFTAHRAAIDTTRSAHRRPVGEELADRDRVLVVERPHRLLGMHRIEEMDVRTSQRPAGCGPTKVSVRTSASPEQGIWSRRRGTRRPARCGKHAHAREAKSVLVLGDHLVGSAASGWVSIAVTKIECGFASIAGTLLKGRAQRGPQSESSQGCCAPPRRRASISASV